MIVQQLFYLKTDLKHPHELKNYTQSEHVSLFSYIAKSLTQLSMNSLWIIVLGINHALEMVHGMS